MLAKDDPRDLVMTTAGPTGALQVQVETKFFEIAVGARKAIDGHEEIWTQITSRPAFEVALLTRADEPCVTLIKKRRLETDPWLTKLPGGYLWENRETEIPAKLKNDTGIKLEFRNLVKLGKVIGHSEIRTPVDLYYSFEWEPIGEPRLGIQIWSPSLSEAVRIALNNGVENDSSFTALMRLYWLWKEGQLIQ